MEEAKRLIRTCVRTFFPGTKQILAIDVLLYHGVMNIDDFVTITRYQQKEMRSALNPLKVARMIHTKSRAEARIANGRASHREYYYVNFNEAVDAIFYRVQKLRKRVESTYQQNERFKDWRCPRCKAEYDEMEVLDKVNDHGFYCERCGTTLEHSEAAVQDRGSHEKIRRLNKQLAKFDNMIAVIQEAVQKGLFPKVDFDQAFADRIRVRGGKDETLTRMEIRDKDASKKAGPGSVDAGAIQVTITSSEEQAKESAEKEEERRRKLAQQNQLPSWMTDSAVGDSKLASTMVGPGIGLKGEEEDKKGEDLVAAKQAAEAAAAMERYRMLMEEEAAEEARKAAEESEEEETDEEDEFEDVDVADGAGTSAIGTPASSQDVRPTAVNGVKREYEDESSDAPTPASLPAGTPAERDAKRVKTESNGNAAAVLVKSEAAAVSDEDDDFEDAIRR